MENTNIATVLSKIEDPIKAAVQMGNMFAQSGLFGVKDPAQGHVIALACLFDGLTPFQVIRRFHIVDGKLCHKADTMLAEFNLAGGICRWLKWDDECAEAEFEFRGNKIVNKFSWEMAQKAGYPFGRDGSLKANWKASRPDMLRSRLISKTIKMIAPEISSGMYSPEEVEDMREIANTLDPKKEVEQKNDLLNGKNQLENSQIEEDLKSEYLMLCAELGETAVSDYLRAIGWIKESETNIDLSDEKMKKIIDRKESFAENVKILCDANNNR